MTVVFKITGANGTNIVNIPITLDRSLVGLSGDFVNYNGSAVRLPDDIDRNNLPAQTDPIWETFQTAEEIDKNFVGATRQIVESVQNVAGFQGLVTRGKLPDYP